MTRRQPKLPLALRNIAAGCAALWLVGIAVCGMGRVCNCANHAGKCTVHGSTVHEHAAGSPHEQAHSHEAEIHNYAAAHQHAKASHDHDRATPQPCADKDGCDDKSCCSTIQVLVPTMTPVVVSKPVSQPVLNISLLCATGEHAFAAPLNETLRRAKPLDWVFTPEVCLGPAFHSLAPPAFVLI